MLVTDLELMEKIVASRKDLEWDGWDVVRYSNHSNAIFHKNGAYRNGKWVKKNIFPLTEDGWHITNTIGKINEQLEK
jgi:hypothetical protein